MLNEVYFELMHLLQQGQNAVVRTQLIGKRGKLTDFEKLLITDSQHEEMAERALTQGFPLTTNLQDKTVLFEPCLLYTSPSPRD